MTDIIVKNRLETTLPLSPSGSEARVGPGRSFGRMLSEAVGETERLRRAADAAIGDLAAGRNVSIHKTMIAMEKASISFKLMMQVRNKVVSAYQEIMRMQV